MLRFGKNRGKYKKTKSKIKKKEKKNVI